MFACFSRQALMNKPKEVQNYIFLLFILIFFTFKKTSNKNFDQYS